MNEEELRSVVREEMAKILANAGLALRRTLQTPCDFCHAGIAQTCEHFMRAR